MCCSLSITACGPDRVVAPIKPPPERLACQAAGDRPAVPPEHVIDWSKVGTVAQAREEHGRFVASVRSREGVVAGYIVRIEGDLFACSNNAAWLREFFGKLPDAEQPGR